MSDFHNIKMLCRTLKVSRSGYYEWLEHIAIQNPEEVVLREEIKKVHKKSRCTYGHRPIRKALQAKGFNVGRKRIIRLMKAIGLRATPFRPNPYSILKNAPESKVCKHRLKRDFSPTRPDRVWTGDITYIWTNSGWVYLAVIIDLFARKVVGWAVSESPDTELTVLALRRAQANRNPRRWRIMFHSDQGCQYTSKDFHDFCMNTGVLQSMSRRGQCWDNAPIESFFGTLKQETGISNGPLENKSQVEMAIFEWIESWYNTGRMHSYIGYCSPTEYEQKWAA